MPKAEPTAFSHGPLTVVVCTYDRYSYLERCVAAVRAEIRVDLGDRLLILDNTPGNPRQKAMAKLFDWTGCQYDVLDRPGLSNARNVGIARAETEFVSFIDDDAFLRPGWRMAMDAALAAYPAANVVGGRILPEFEIARPPWLNAQMLGGLAVVDWAIPMGPLPRDKWLAGANVTYRRAAVEAAGGFDTSLGRNGTSTLLSNEETILAGKLDVALDSQIYQPDAVVDHIIPAKRTTLSHFIKRNAWQAVSDHVAKGDGAFVNIDKDLEALLDENLKLDQPLRYLGDLFSSDTSAEGTALRVSLAYAITAALLNGHTRT